MIFKQHLIVIPVKDSKPSLYSPQVQHPQAQRYRCWYLEVCRGTLKVQRDVSTALAMSIIVIKSFFRQVEFLNNLVFDFKFIFSSCPSFSPSFLSFLAFSKLFWFLNTFVLSKRMGALKGWNIYISWLRMGNSVKLSSEFRWAMKRINHII